MDMGVDLDELHPGVELGHVHDDVGALAAEMQVFDTDLAEHAVAVGVEVALVILSRDRLTVFDAVDDFVQLRALLKIVFDAAVILKVGGRLYRLRLLLKAFPFEQLVSAQGYPPKRTLSRSA